MPTASTSRILPLAVSTAASAGVGMIPLHRLPSALRTAYVVLPAAAGAGVVLAALRRLPAPEAEGSDATGTPSRGARRTAMRIGLPLAVGGLIAGVSAGSLALDRGIEAALRRRGVPAPRVIIGLGAGALTLGMDLLADRLPREDPAGEAAEPTSPPSAR